MATQRCVRMSQSGFAIGLPQRRDQQVRVQVMGSREGLRCDFMLSRSGLRKTGLELQSGRTGSRKHCVIGDVDGSFYIAARNRASHQEADGVLLAWFTDRDELRQTFGRFEIARGLRAAHARQQRAGVWIRIVHRRHQ